ncbi:hypothetical protein LINPERHAP1_LOCUS23338, partial [Linum perenne]
TNNSRRNITAAIERFRKRRREVVKIEEEKEGFKEEKFEVVMVANVRMAPNRRSKARGSTSEDLLIRSIVIF